MSAPFNRTAKADTDGDELSDAQEVQGFKTKSGFRRPGPVDFDTDRGSDGDGFELSTEQGHPENPCRPD